MKSNKPGGQPSNAESGDVFIGDIAKIKGELLTYHRMAASGVWVPSEKYSEMIAALKWIKEKTETDPAGEVELRSRASIVYSTACRALKGIV